jgi:vacuolar-type H+-ATPase subunit C/Vma6
MINTTLNVTNALLNATNSSLLNASSTSKFFSMLNNPPMMTFVLSILAVVVIMVFVVKSVSPLTHFIYANARIHARSNYVVTDSLLLSLMEAKSLKEFRSQLRETDYGEELEKTNENLRSVHTALEKGFISSVLELVGLSPEKSKPLLNAYLMFFETKILKIIYRAKLMNVKIDESLVYAIGKLDSNLLKHLMDTETIADMSVVMASTEYTKVFESKYSNLEEFEVKIDEFVYNNFISIINKTKMYDGVHIIDILNKKIDISNILAILKFRIRGIEKEKQKGFLMNNGTDLCLRFDKLIEAEKLKDFVEALKGLPYYEPLLKALEEYDKDKALSHFENELYRFFKKLVVGNELSHTLGPYPLFSYLIKAEIGLRNLFIVSRGIDAGFSSEKIKEMMII